MSWSRLTLLWIGLAAAPLAWFAQLTIGYEAVEGGCAPGGGRGDVFGIGVESAALAVTILALAVASVGLAAAVVTWRGSADPGYSTFLGFVGMLGGVVLMGAIVLSGVGIVALDGCMQS